MQKFNIAKDSSHQEVQREDDEAQARLHGVTWAELRHQTMTQAAASALNKTCCHHMQLHDIKSLATDVAAALKQATCY
jgi:hypothetical protein